MSMRKPLRSETELAVIEKTHELLVWTIKHIEKFPRTHRHGIGQRLEQRLSLIFDLLVESKYAQRKLELLERTNLLLEQLRFDFRVVKDLHCLSIDSFGSACRFINEIGRQVGGWLKHTRGLPHETPRESLAGVDPLREPVARGSERRPR